jgi:hypothetical protein
MNLTCNLCPEGRCFSVPALPDPAGAAMMAEHLEEEHDVTLEGWAP